MFQVQFISHFTSTVDYVASVRIALLGGCKWIQLRMKDASPEEAREAAIAAQNLCRAHGATFIIDDRVELVRELKADGVHLGKEDMPVEEARALLGKGFIIGGTANTIADIRRLYRAGVDYVGCGPFRYTTTKARLAPILGLEGYRSIIKTMRQEGIGIPVVGIGGVTAEDIPQLKDVGLDGIALSGSILRAPDSVAEMERVIRICNGN